MIKGSFISCEGPDGAGKSTQILRLADYLRSKGFTVVHTREPGGTPLAEKLRALIINESMPAMSEVMALYAGRLDHIENLIVPALERGEIVLSDRFFDSAYAYQGWGRGMMKQLRQVHQLTVRNFEPDYTLYFDITLEESADRFQKRKNPGGLDKFEQETTTFFRQVFAGFEECFRDNPQRMHRIDASGDLQVVTDRVLRWVDQEFIPTYSKPDKGVSTLRRWYYAKRRSVRHLYRAFFKLGGYSS